MTIQQYKNQFGEYHLLENMFVYKNKQGIIKLSRYQENHNWILLNENPEDILKL